MGNWYSSRTVSIAASGYRNALNDNSFNGATLKKQRNAIKKPHVISALVRILCNVRMTVANINIYCMNPLISAESY